MEAAAEVVAVFGLQQGMRNSERRVVWQGRMQAVRQRTPGGKLVRLQQRKAAGRARGSRKGPRDSGWVAAIGVAGRSRARPYKRAPRVAGGAAAEGQVSLHPSRRPSPGILRHPSAPPLRIRRLGATEGIPSGWAP